MREFRGRVAVVTGAASGIGRALAGRFAAEGMRCVLADVDDGALHRAVGELRRDGAAAIGVRTDVASAADVQALADTTVSDLWGVIHGCRTFLPLLLEQDEAHIVNTSSMAALNGHPLGQAPYTTAKFGVLGLSQNLFFELAATSRAALAGALEAALDPAKVADVVLDAVRDQRFYILPHPEEAFDMAEQQLRWMRTGEPLRPGPGVARSADG
jgi:NAD(P)-dependent dehydrogenase (short-subunit alcohol dehydrogenase family)